MKPPGESANPPHSQTLDRGVRLLELLADSVGPISVADAAEQMGLHRSIVYRMFRTLEEHRLVSRTELGAYQLAVGLSVLARAVSRDLQSAAMPELAEVADELGMTCFLVVADADDCVTLASVEPRRTVASLVHRPGTRHPLDRGAPGLALLSTTAKTGRERAELTAARRLGYAASHDEVIPGLSSLAAPIPSAHGAASAAVAVVYVGADVDVVRVGRRLQAAAAQIAAAIG